MAHITRRDLPRNGAAGPASSLIESTLARDSSPTPISGSIGPAHGSTSNLAVARRIKSFTRVHLNTRQLTFLVRLNEESRLSRAASAAGLTQSAASKVLRQVEAALGVQLFERHARGVVPTCYGEILLRHARLALSELGLAYEEIAALKSGFAGKVAIGTVTNPATSLVPMAVGRVKQRHPDIVINIDVDSSKQLVQKLLQGTFDIVVGRVLDAAGADALVYEPLADDEPHAIIASVDHPLAGRRDVQLKELIEQPWIFPPAGSLVRDKMTAKLVEQGLPLPTNIVETASLPVITALLRQNNMIVALPEETVQDLCEAGLLTALVRNLPLGVGAFGLITRREHKLSLAAQLMLNTLRELAGQVYPAPRRVPVRLKA
ncbi:MAG: LysR family transcriptional regulator [Steroidobacteraceae bacterium]